MNREALAFLPPLPQTEMLKRVATRLWTEEDVIAVWLGGSFARGEADRYSDIDLRLASSPSSSLAANPRWMRSTATFRFPQTEAKTVTDIFQAQEPSRTRAVGIAGGSASGKTTFAAALTAALEAGDQPRQVEVFHMDRYALTDRTAGPSFVFLRTGERLFNMNHPDAFDIPRLLDDIAARLTAENGPDVLVVEGLMVLHEKALRQCLDLRIFLELDADERALRRMLRDMAGGRASRDPQFIVDYYRESARVGHALYIEPSRVHADLILRGDGDFDRLARMVTSIISGC